MVVVESVVVEKLSVESVVVVEKNLNLVVKALVVVELHFSLEELHFFELEVAV